jgi:aldehyde:ferredoxin oxidoreductase
MYLGGRGLGVHLLWSELGDHWEELDPLGPENLFLVLTGPATGYHPGIKTVIVAKSPESNGVVGSAVSSEVGLELRASGYDGIVFRGAAARPAYLLVHNDTVELCDASRHWGMGGIALYRTLLRDVHQTLIEREGRTGLPKEPAMLYVGPAGERRVRFAAVMAKLAHAAGYGGLGAVMGSKNLKAILVKGSRALPAAHDGAAVRHFIEEMHRQTVGKSPFGRWGTAAGGYSFGNESSSEPIRNWQDEWHDDSRISVAQFESRAWIKKRWADYGCPVNCMKVSCLRHGPYAGAITDGPDYELMAYLGTNLGIFEPEKIIYLSSLVEELGLDAINAGNVLGFAAELYQRAVLTADDLGLPLEWGDAEAFGRLMHAIAEKRGIGAVLAQGTYRAAIEIGREKGIDVLPYAVQSKGIAIGAHGIRSDRDFISDPIGYAVSTQGGDHTSTSGLPAKEYARELRSIFHDSATTCTFASSAGFDVLLEFLNALTGFGLTKTDWFEEIGPRILHLQRLLLLLGGPDVHWDPRRDDDNPPRFYEPLRAGPAAGMAPTRDEIAQQVAQYYAEVGFDDLGIPKDSELERLSIGEAKREAERIRHRLA